MHMTEREVRTKTPRPNRTGGLLRQDAEASVSMDQAIIAESSSEM